jgi:hypothetical protein
MICTFKGLNTLARLFLGVQVVKKYLLYFTIAVHHIDAFQADTIGYTYNSFAANLWLGKTVKTLRGRLRLRIAICHTGRQRIAVKLSAHGR